MSPVMLDTDVCSYAIRDVHGGQRALNRVAPVSHLCISALTRSELRFGAARDGVGDRLRTAIELFLAGVPTMAWDARAADRHGLLRAELRARGESIGTMDEMIAAHALALGAELVTNNVRHFSRVPDLDIRAWDVAAA